MLPCVKTLPTFIKCPLGWENSCMGRRGMLLLLRIFIFAAGRHLHSPMWKCTEAGKTNTNNCMSWLKGNRAGLLYWITGSTVLVKSELRNSARPLNGKKANISFKKKVSWEKEILRATICASTKIKIFAFVWERWSHYGARIGNTRMG